MCKGNRGNMNMVPWAAAGRDCSGQSPEERQNLRQELAPKCFATRALGAPGELELGP